MAVELETNTIQEARGRVMMSRRELASLAFEAAALGLWLESFMVFATSGGELLANSKFFSASFGSALMSSDSYLSYYTGYIWATLLTAVLLAFGGRALSRNSQRLAAQLLGDESRGDSSRAARMSDALVIGATLLGIYFCASGCVGLAKSVNMVLASLLEGSPTRYQRMVDTTVQAVSLDLFRTLAGIGLFKGAPWLAALWRRRLGQ